MRKGLRLFDAGRRGSSIAPALALLIVGCQGDPPSSDDDTTGTTGTTGAATSTTSGAESSSSGAVDSTGGGTTSGTTGEGSESSGSTGEPGIIDPGCPECIVLADGLQGGRGISLHGGFVYYTDQAAGTVNRVPIGGGEVEELVDKQPEPYDVEANDDYLFWTTFIEGGSVWRANLPAGPPIALSADEFPRKLQLVEDQIYWCAFDDVEGRVRRVQIDGIGNPPETLVTVGRGVADLVVHGESVYFTAHEPPAEKGLAPPGVVYSASADVPTDVLDLVPIGLDQSEPWGIAIASGTVFWANGLGNPDDQPQSIVASPLLGGGLNVVALDQTAPWGVAADGQYVYWTDYTDVWAVAHGGGEAILLAELQVIARSIVVDEDNVYWITRERVLQRPKP